MIFKFFEHRLTSEYGDMSVSYLPEFDVNIWMGYKLEYAEVKKTTLQVLRGSKMRSNE